MTLKAKAHSDILVAYKVRTSVGQRVRDMGSINGMGLYYASVIALGMAHAKANERLPHSWSLKLTL